MTFAAQQLSVTPPASRFSGRSLALGFAVTVAMWVIGYIALMNPGLLVGEVLFGLILIVLFAGGWIAGRHRTPGESPVWAGATVGLVSATLNMLIVGSLLDRQSERELFMQVALWIGGVYAGSVLLTAIGAVAGALGGSALGGSALRAESHCSESSATWYSIFTIVAAATVFLLLITGGLVTSLEAGLAVPDWPNSFGHNMLLYPLEEMLSAENRQIGVHVEHVHRLYGMLVGLTAITLAVTMPIFDRRPWMWALAGALLLLVVIQGVLGGTRVTETSTALAIIHGVFGQIVFAMAVSIAAFTSPLWKSAGEAVGNGQQAIRKTGKPLLPNAHCLLPVLLLLQLVLGALYRHLGHIHILFTHIFVAVLVTATIIFAAGRAWTFHRHLPVLPLLGKLLLALVGVQLVLGVTAMLVVLSRDGGGARAGDTTSMLEAIIATAHQATGALLLGLATLLMLWTSRLLTVPVRSARASQM